MSLTNLELAANPTWISAEVFSECRFCGFLSQDLELDRPSVPCPRCKLSGLPRFLYPDIASIRRLEMIADAFVQAYARTGERQAALAEQIRSDLRRSCDPSWVATAIRKVRKLRCKHPASAQDYAKLLATLQRRLSLDTPEQTQRVYFRLATYEETSTEHSNLVVLTTALFEGLFSELLIRLLVSRGTDYGDARVEVRRTRTFEGRRKLFERETHTPLRQAVRRFGHRGFYERWEYVRELRNRFAHQTPFAIGADALERAFNLAKDSFALFAFLHNS